MFPQTGGDGSQHLLLPVSAQRAAASQSPELQTDGAATT